MSDIKLKKTQIIEGTVNRKTRRAFIAAGKKIAFVDNNKLYINILDQDVVIAELDPRWERDGITVEQLVREYISVVQLEIEIPEETSEESNSVGVSDEDPR